MSGEPKDQSIIGSVAWRVLTALIIIVIVFLLFAPLWTLSPVQVVLHTLLAFLAIVGAAVICFDIQNQSVTGKYLFLSFFVFIAIVNFVAAIWFLNPLYYISDVVEVSADLIEMLLIGALLLGAILPTKFTQSETSVKRGMAIFAISTIVALFLYGGLYYFVLPFLLALNPLFTGMGFGSICLAICIGIFIIFWQSSQVLHRFDAATIVAGLLLMVISTACLMVSYVSPFTCQSASMMYRAIMVFSIFIAVAIPVQKELGISEKRAEIYASTLALLAVVPYTLTLLVVAIIPLAWVFPEQGILTT